jgi:hypothetical protein
MWFCVSARSAVMTLLGVSVRSRLRPYLTNEAVVNVRFW